MSAVRSTPDRLMWGEADIRETDVRYYDVLEPSFDLYGFYEPRKENGFKRLPDEIGKNVNSGVAKLYTNTAGGRVRFCTDSLYVIVRVSLPNVTRFDHMPLTGSAGLDLYIDDPCGGRSVFGGLFRPSVDMTNGFVSIIKFRTKKQRYLTVNFPLYNDVSSLEIGLQEDATLKKGLSYRNALPIVYYGSSITQGGCAGRPGNCYENMIARRWNLDYLNLGFSGSGKAEDLIVNYMAELPMCAFVSDYDHNAPNAEYLRATHQKMYDTIRGKNPDLPYIMVSRPDFVWHSDSEARRDIIADTYRYARAQGDQNVYYIDGETFFKGEWEDCCTVDTVHPNDLGFRFMADSIGNTLGKLILT